MVQYAYYDSTIAQPAPVLSWFDTGVVDYPNLPAANDLLQMTEEQWAVRISGAPWAVLNRTLVTYQTPQAVLSLSQQASNLQFAGLIVNSGSRPDFDATYAIDPTAQGKIGAISTYILVNSKFPGGLDTYPWIDLAGTPHMFWSTAMFQQFATTVADYVAALDFIIATNSGSLPESSVMIS